MRSTRAERRAREVTNKQREDETREGTAREREAGTQGSNIEQV